jgi:steroid 5-alpha reductase family enzyme
MTSSSRSGRTTAFAWVSISYLLAGAAAIATFQYLRPVHTKVDGTDWNLIGAILVADIVATLVVFAFSFLFRNSSFYDPYWSVAPIVIGVGLLVLGRDSGADAMRGILVLALVTFWGLRLTWNWARGWPGLHHQDWRYDDFQRSTGRWYWLVSFSGIHFFPTVLVFLGCMALVPVYVMPGRPFGIMDVFAAAFTLAAILIETVADEQLRKARREGISAGTLRRGLWGWSRNPNYLGETSFWWGLFFFAGAARPDWWPYAVAGPVAMSLLFHFISIPMKEKRMLARRPDYAQVMAEVPRWLSWRRR